MNIYGWILVCWIALGGILNIGMIGKPRPTITPFSAIIGLLTSVGLIALLFGAVSS